MHIARNMQSGRQARALTLGLSSFVGQRFPTNRSFQLLLVGRRNASLRDVMDEMDVLLWICLPAFIAGGGAFYYFKFGRSKVDENPLYFRCPGCTRKIRYFKRQIGHRGMCSNCKTLWTFPVASVRRNQ
jgi:hypothetical protein